MTETRDPAAITSRRNWSWWRSPWFWLGWPGLIGLLWGWLAFTNDDYRVLWVTEKGRAFTLGGGDGEFYVERSQLFGESLQRRDKGLNWSWAPDRWEDQGCVFMRKPWVLSSVDSPPASWSGLYVAAWAAVLAYLAAWGGLLGWRSRCVRKKSRSEDP